MRGFMRDLIAVGVLMGLPGTALAAEAAPVVDTGDTAWVLMSAALVMLMTPGLAFFTAAWYAAKTF